MEQNEDRNCRAAEMFMQKTVPFEVTSEFVLPDYRSEISRLLWVRPVFSAPTRFIGGGKADFSGAIRYEVLYIGPDGKLYGAEPEDGYAFSTPVELPAGFENGGVEVCAQVTPDTVVSRVTAPRKLSVRCRLHGDVRGYGMKDLSPQLEGAGTEQAGDRAEKLCTVAENGRYLGSGTETLELTGEIYPDGREDVRVITSHGEVFLTDVSAVGDGMRCRGEMEVTLLCTAQDEEEKPFALPLILPFECVIPMEGVQSDCRGRAMGSPGRIEATVEENRIGVSASVSLFAEATGTEPVIVCRDLFVPGYEAEYRFGEENLYRAGSCGNRNFSVNEECAKKDIAMPEDGEILMGVCQAELRERVAEGKNTALTGELTCDILYTAGGEYGVAQMRVPLRTVVEDGSGDLMVSACAPKCRLRAEREKIGLNAEVVLAMRGSATERVRALCGAKLTPDNSAPQNDPELFYPDRGETLFDVGKRYGMAPATIAQVNGISADDPGDDESLSGVRYLLIPPR